MSPEVGQEGAVVLDIGGHDLGPDQSWKVRSARDRTIRTIRTIRILSKILIQEFFLENSEISETLNIF